MKKSIKIELDDDIVDGINLIYNRQKDEGVESYNEFLANIFLMGVTVLATNIMVGISKDHEETRDNLEKNNE